MLLVRQFAVKAVSATLFALSGLVAMPVMAQAPQAAVRASTPEAFVQQITNEVLGSVKTDKAIQQGDLRQITALIDSKIMPHVNFTRMTAATVGPAWRRATPEQRQRLEREFKTLLIYTYAGASSQMPSEVVIEYLPSRAKPTDSDVVVRTLIKTKGEPIQLNYRLEKSGDAWKVYDVNVMGAWLVQTHQSSFAQEINASGIDGLISKLNERNRQLIAKSGGK